MGAAFDARAKNLDTKLLATVVETAGKIVLGKEREFKLAIAGILARGHLLIEDLPGMGKTTFVLCLSKLLGLRMSRIQFTNDVLPADIIGVNIFDAKSQNFKFHEGPIFAEIVLGDELNRASPKTQSAFLQAMEEQKVSVENQTHNLPQPFAVIATQNPQDQVGTNPLPESQLDRFMIRFSIGYPDQQSEVNLLVGGSPRQLIETTPSQLTKADVLRLQSECEKVHVSRPIAEYVQEILTKSRMSGKGLSPRAGLLLIQMARAWAMLSGRDMVLPDDIQDLALYVFSHRLGPQGDKRVRELLESIPVP